MTKEEMWQKVVDTIREYNALFGKILVDCPHDEWEISEEDMEEPGIIKPW
jgi:hypothetical protein